MEDLDIKPIPLYGSRGLLNDGVDVERGVRGHEEMHGHAVVGVSDSNGTTATATEKKKEQNHP